MRRNQPFRAAPIEPMNKISISTISELACCVRRVVAGDMPDHKGDWFARASRRLPASDLPDSDRPGYSCGSSGGLVASRRLPRQTGSRIVGPIVGRSGGIRDRKPCGSEFVGPCHFAQLRARFQPGLAGWRVKGIAGDRRHCSSPAGGSLVCADEARTLSPLLARADCLPSRCRT